MNDNGICGHIGLEWHRVAPTCCAHGLGIDRRRAILTDHAIRTLVEPYCTADFARIKDAGDFAIRLLVEPEANLSPVFVGLEAMQVAIRNLSDRNADLSVRERDLNGGRK